MRKNYQCVRDFSEEGLFPLGFLFPSFFLLKKSVALICSVLGGGGFRKFLGTSVPKKSFHYSGPSPMRPNELWTCPDTEPPGPAPGCQPR